MITFFRKAKISRFDVHGWLLKFFLSFSTKCINKENEIYILYFYYRGICTIHARKRLKTLYNVLLIYFKFIVIG